MIFYFLVMIVFIAELIIAITIVGHIYRWHKVINEYNDLLLEIQPQIKSIAEISRKISEQILELAPTYVSGLKLFLTELFFDNIINIVSSLMLFKAKKSQILKKKFWRKVF